jgi:hypothetical protein
MDPLRRELIRIFTIHSVILVPSKTTTCGFAYHCKRRTGINGVLKQGSKRKGITGDWRQLGNKELYKSYTTRQCYDNKSRVNEMGI